MARPLRETYREPRTLLEEGSAAPWSEWTHALSPIESGLWFTRDKRSLRAIVTDRYGVYELGIAKPELHQWPAAVYVGMASSGGTTLRRRLFSNYGTGTNLSNVVRESLRAALRSGFHVYVRWRDLTGMHARIAAVETAYLLANDYAFNVMINGAARSRVMGPGGLGVLWEAMPASPVISVDILVTAFRGMSVDDQTAVRRALDFAPAAGGAGAAAAAAPTGTDAGRPGGAGGAAAVPVPPRMPPDTAIEPAHGGARDAAKTGKTCAAAGAAKTGKAGRAAATTAARRSP
jgi:hypothetical protein